MCQTPVGQPQQNCGVCTNYIQVLDVCWLDMKCEFLIEHGCVMQKEDVPMMSQKLLDESDFTDVIQRAFQGYELYP